MKVIGHRGAAGLFAENTLSGFRGALGMGADVLECDVQQSRDGQLVLMHDRTVDRTTDGHGAVADLTLAELSALHCAGGERIPTLDALLQAVGEQAELAIELKTDGIEAACLQAVRKAGLLRSTTFICFTLERLSKIKSLDDRARIGTLFMQTGAEQWRSAQELHAEVIDTHFESLTTELVAQAHASGQQLWIWTVNEASALQEMTARGPDGITTDYPDRLLQQLGRLA